MSVMFTAKCLSPKLWTVRSQLYRSRYFWKKIILCCLRMFFVFLLVFLFSLEQLHVISGNRDRPYRRRPPSSCSRRCGREPLRTSARFHRPSNCAWAPLIALSQTCGLWSTLKRFFHVSRFGRDSRGCNIMAFLQAGWQQSPPYCIHISRETVVLGLLLFAFLNEK